MFWAFKIRDQIQRRFDEKIASGRPLVIRDEWSASGPPHVGSLRGVVIHGCISEVLTQAKVANKFLFEINDFEAMDGLPAAVDAKKFEPYLGKLLTDVPSPDRGADNFADHWAAEMTSVIEKTGYAPEFYRSSELYSAGRYNEVIRGALDSADAIRAIYQKVAGSTKDPRWLPIQVVCESCGKVATTLATAWDGEYVTYSCLPEQVTWAQGCGHEGRISPFDGRAKLPWKVEWAAKFKILEVDIEGAGKDHNTKGGSRDIARAILAEVFHHQDPVNIPYDFFTVQGKKMASSMGLGATAREVADHLPTSLLRYLNMKEPKQPIEFDPRGDTIPILFDNFDRIAGDHFSGAQTEWGAVLPFTVSPAERSAMTAIFRPRFSQIAYLVQMPHIDLAERVAAMKGSELNDPEKQELAERVRYARLWLKDYSPEKYQFTIQETVPESAQSLDEDQKKALAAILGYVTKRTSLVGDELHGRIHEIKKEQGIEPQRLFSAVYQSFLGKDSGPQAGWFLSALDRDFVVQRLTAVTRR